jgi:osmotically-inducible protein OsmY
MKLFRNLSIVSIGLLVAACDVDQDASRAVEQAVAREILAPAADTDQQLAEKVEKALGLNAGSPPYGVAVTASGGRIMLWGTVESEATRKRFEVIAAGVVGVTSLDNRLQVDPGV